MNFFFAALRLVRFGFQAILDITGSSIGPSWAPFQDGRHGSKMATMAQRWPPGPKDGRYGSVQAQVRVTTSDDPVTRSVSPRKVS